MTHEPLMLSDTAMLLLDRYIQLEEEERLRLENLIPDDNGLAYRRYESIYAGGFAWDVIEKCVLELQVLWTHRDLPVERHLAWHFVLNEDFVAQCRMMFNPSRGHQPTVMRERAPGFIYNLAKAYQKALEERRRAHTEE